MPYRIIAVGKDKSDALAEAEAEYRERLRRFDKVEVIMLPERVREHDGRPVDLARDQALEAAEIECACSSSGLRVMLDIAGTEWDSAALAHEVESWRQRARMPIQLILGGSWGLDPALRQRVDVRWSLSRATLPHQLARVVMLEQLVRAHSILNGRTYHK